MFSRFQPFLLFVFVTASPFISTDAQDQPGFTSIDCGLPVKDTGYEDTGTGIIYTSDQNLYIDTGVNTTVDANFIDDSVDRHLRTVRYFSDDVKANRSCYNLTSLQPANKRYLIRATFRYGNYDGRDQPPTFHLYLGADFWDTVELKNSTSVIRKEIIHVPTSNYLYVCLVDSGTGTPFISALELRLLNGDAYKTEKPGQSLAYYLRWNFAPANPSKTVRYPEDKYDRVWYPYSTPDYWTELNTTSPMTEINDLNYRPPEAVVQSAVEPRNANDSLFFYWTPADPQSTFYIYMYITDVAKPRAGENRAFQINFNGAPWQVDDVVPWHDRTFISYTTSGYTRDSFNFSLVKSANSTLPPIINAVEAYAVKQQLHSLTDENDVVSILRIKSVYGLLKRDWQGDPCSPKAFIWDGLDCSFNNDTSLPPRIISLNLSSYGLKGIVSSYFSTLTSLESLDLSNNNLDGSIPEFLAELPQLKVLDISGNNFSGSIPQRLLDIANNSLILRADRSQSGAPDKCEAGKCQSSNKSFNFVKLIVVLLSATILLIVVASILIWRFRRTKSKDKKFGSSSLGKDGFLRRKNMHFSYSEILKMTNNFQRILGKGGFGTVYHGTTADGKQVAVKLLSESSAQGYKEFQTEAELLTIVHHRNLTILVGYCYEGTHMALVYEYMAYGNLREHLSGDNHVLSWSERLHILLDAAQGLDYLHNGCKPPIIHRDIKSTNILLNDNFEAKLADFGLSRAFTIDDSSYVSTKVVGTPGYLDPEYYESQRLHEKSDIYSFGVVMLELITGRAVISGPELNRSHVVHWVSSLLEAGDVASIVDPKLKGNYDVNTVWRALEIAMACVSPTSFERPNTARVLAELKDFTAPEKGQSENRDSDASYLLKADQGILEIDIKPR